MADREGIHIPGFKTQTTASSIVRIYKSLLSWAGSGGEREEIEALDSEEAVTKMAIVARCWKMSDICQIHDHEAEGSNAGEDEHIHGIQCVCRSAGLTARICEVARRGPHVIAVSSTGAADRYVALVGKLFGVSDRGQEPFMTAVVYRGGHLIHRPPPGHLMLGDIDVKALTARFDIRKDVPDSVLADPNFVNLWTSSGIIPRTTEASFTTEGPARVAFTQERVILVVSVRSSDQVLTFRQLLTVDRKARRQSEQGRISLKLTGAILAASVYDGDRDCEDYLANYGRKVLIGYLLPPTTTTVSRSGLLHVVGGHRIAQM